MRASDAELREQPDLIRNRKLPLYILACDHRRSFERLLGIVGVPTEADVQRMKDVKQLVWQGFQLALSHGVSSASAGILIDLQYGEQVAREAKRLGVIFALPVEKSGQQEFELEHGNRFVDIAEEFQPTYVKALVRYNPDGNAKMNARQRDRLKHLSDWLSNRPYGFLFELLVPPEPHHLAKVNDNLLAYDQALRPGLMLAAIEELQDANIEPNVWKIEGLESRDDCCAIGELVRRNGRCSSCVVLGRGASTNKVDEWLRAARGLPGYLGFAIGRSIFADALDGLANGSIATRADAEAKIAHNFARFVSIYRP